MATGAVLNEVPSSLPLNKIRSETPRYKHNSGLTVDNFTIAPKLVASLGKSHIGVKIPMESTLVNGHKAQQMSLNGHENGNGPQYSGRIAKSYTTPRNCKDHGYVPTKDPEKFYLTSNRRDFFGAQGSRAPSTRPQSSRFYPKGVATGKDMYSEEYGWKAVPKAEQLRPGTASGQRKNNPHPLEAFLIWRFPGKIPDVDQLHNITDEAMQEVCKQKLRSTYQVDYTGAPQGVQTQTVYEGFPKTKFKEPVYTLDSTTRIDYQPPLLQRGLRNNISRYGCNGRKWQPALGVVPTVSEMSPFLQGHGNTHYKKEFRPKLTELPPTSFTKSDVLPVIQDYIRRAKPEDQEVIGRLLDAIDFKKQGENPLERLSDWEGPH